ncbi:MAG: formate/nitrite transporter family protein [Terriglobales bacterium]
MEAQAEPERSTRRTAHEIYDKVKENARAELDRSPHALAFSGAAGGFAMGLTALAVASTHSVLGNSPAADFAALLFYPAGFVAVIIGRFQLFTENTLYQVVLVLTERRHVWETLRLLAIVLLFNIVGACLFALLVGLTSSVQPKTQEELVKLGLSMVASSRAEAFWSGIIGGWIIALVAWLVSASHWTIGQVAVTWLLCYIVGAGHYAHCIASSGEILVATVRGASSVGAYVQWLVFAIMGNVVGGVTLVSIMNWGQVHAGETR